MLHSRFVFGPLWQTQLALGLVFGTFMGVAAFWRGDNTLLSAMAVGAFNGLLFGVIFGWWQHRQAAPLRQLLAGQRPSREARRAVSRGPLPGNPHDREVTRLLLTRELADLGEHQRLNAIIFGLVALVGVLLAMSGEPAAIALSVIGIGFLVLLPRRLNRLRERQALFAG